MDHAADAQDYRGARPKYRGPRALEEPVDPTAISPACQLRTQLCTHYKTGHPDNQHDRNRNHHLVPTLIERTETRWQEKNSQSKYQQKSNPHTAVDHDADGCVPPTAAKASEKPTRTPSPATTGNI